MTSRRENARPHRAGEAAGPAVREAMMRLLPRYRNVSPAGTAVPHVLIVGSGFAGFHCARELERRMRPGEVRVTMASPTDYMLYSPLLPHVAAGILKPADIAVPLRRALRHSLRAPCSLRVTWASRTEQPGGKTSPEELAAAAHSSCFAMALALKLGENNTPPQRLDITSTVTLNAVDGVPTITTSRLKVTAQVGGLDADGFAAVVEQAAALCPVSRLFAGAQISVEAELETEPARSAD